MRSAWLRFPDWVLEPLDQLYRRLGARTYWYESEGGTFVAELQVDETGIITHYPGLWAVEQGR